MGNAKTTGQPPPKLQDIHRERCGANEQWMSRALSGTDSRGFCHRAVGLNRDIRQLSKKPVDVPWLTHQPAAATKRYMDTSTWFLWMSRAFS
jgi:hypothetical protein